MKQTFIVGDAKTHQLIVARNGIWVDALETYKKEELKNQN